MPIFKARVTPVVAVIFEAPLLFAFAALLVAIVAGLGRGAGLPFLFRTAQGTEAFWGGLGMGWTLVQICLTAFVIDAIEERLEKPLRWGRYALWTAGPLLALAALFSLNGLTSAGRLGFCSGLALGGALLLLSVPWLLQRARVLVPDWAARRLPGLKDWPEVHGLAVAIFLAAALLYGALWFYTRVLERPGWGVPPGLAVCVLLSAITAIYGFVAHHFPAYHNWAFVFVAFAWLGLNGLPRFKHQFENLDYGASRQTASEAVAPLPSDGDVLRTWAAGGKRPLVVLAASGGGIRAAVWTSLVLEALETKVPSFPYHVRVVTGASGGMVGAALYVATLQSPGSPSTHAWKGGALSASDLVDEIAQDSLAPLVRQLVFRDIGLPVFQTAHDRGWALERSFESNTAGALGQPVAALAQGEAQGWRPSLLISPMIVEDGRRMLVSNLDLQSLTRAKGPFLGRDGTPYSVSAQEFFKLFPRASNFKLSSAVRANASFPYVTPAPVLPLDPPVRLVDAGYYDEPGVNLAALWLLAHAGELPELASRVILIQVRDAPDQARREQVRRGPTPWYRRAFHGVATPLEGLFNSRSAVMAFRNDELVSLADRRLNGTQGEFFTTALFEFDQAASLSWRLTPEDMLALRRSIGSGANATTVARIADWFQ